MGLTETQRAELDAIVIAAQYGRPWSDEMRGQDKAMYRLRRDRLNDLLAAWRAVDLDTRMTLAAALVRMGDEHSRDHAAPVPDLQDVVEEHLAGIALPGGNRERTNGFREAVLFLWDAWRVELPLDCEPRVGEEALAFIAPIIAEVFNMPLPRATQRTYDRLRALEKTERGLPGRKGARN